MLSEHLYILSPHFENIVDENTYDIDFIGQKAKGLLSTEKTIVPPFAVITSNIFDTWYNVEQAKAEELLDSIIKEILVHFNEMGVFNFIVRSSAKYESFEERGFYQSSESTNGENLKTIIIETFFNNVEFYKKFKENRFSIIIQEFIKPILTGHLSNERRINRSKTHFLYEIVDDKNNFVENNTFSLSSNRMKYEYDFSTSIKCKNKKDLIISLKRLSNYLLKDENRHHVEWVWDKKNLWIVQNDTEKILLVGETPGATWKISKINKENRDLKSFSVLASCQKQWGKVKCLKTFLECELPYGQIYILDNPTLIKSLSLGEKNIELVEDLKWLLQYPVIVRMDKLNSDEYSTVLLPRTETLFNIDAVFNFLIKYSNNFIEQGLTEDNFCFLIHRYINAKACALAFSKPDIPRARIDSTWGIVDGLYYHPHDSFEVNLSNDIIKKKIRCKTEYLDVDKEGNWISIKAGSDWDWAESLSQKQLQTIAKYNATISEKLNLPVTVMYFVDIDVNTGYASILPWYYTTEEITNSGEKFTDIIFSESRELIQSEDDFKKMELRLTNVEKTKFAIKLKLNTNILRDKEFIENVGRYAKEKKIPIELEGSILSHTYYILQKIGAQVKCIDPFNPTYEKQEFYKLVRDKIKINIESKGETTTTANIDTTQLLEFLKEKAIEEALEFFWENDKDKIVEELADIFEVIRSTCKLFDIDIKEINDVADNKIKSKGGFETGLLLLDTSESSLISIKDSEEKVKNKLSNRSIKLKREKLKIQTNSLESSITLPYIIGGFQKSANKQIKFGSIFQNKNIEIIYSQKGIKIYLDRDKNATNPNQLNLF